MTDSNAATRLKDIHAKLAQGRSDSILMQKVWAEVFGLPTDAPQTEDWVVEAVVAFRMELEHARQQLDNIGVPSDLTNHVFTRLKHAASPTFLTQQWAHHKSALVGIENTLVLRWCDWALRTLGEAEIEAQQFQSIKNHLAELEQLLNEPDVPPAIREFVQRQVNDIRSALRLYPIHGLRVLRKAVDTATGAFTTPDDQVVAESQTATPATKGVLRKSAEILKEAAEVTGQADKLFTTLAKYAPALNGAMHVVVEALSK
ncbi:hypothetical protein [Hydrogenophaga sp. 5NK40-0174]|uniref:hypothetical protein n=1 Tax=Hydrogenophaga sp. 5NK40-0174 TaxID=3127649 RepID=UPI0031028DBD